MRSSAIFGLSLLSVLLPFTQAAHGSQRRHNAVAHRARGDVQVHKRTDNARFTYYAVGLGACGQTNVPSDFIVALNSPMYGDGYPGPNCFKSITITANGKTTQATIMDECPGCPYGGLDFSEGLFKFFADESVGVLYGSWWYNDGSGGGGNNQPTTSSSQWTPPTSTWEPPSSTWTPPTTSWTPTSTWTPPSSTWSPPSSSSTWSSSSSSSWSSSSSSWSSSSSSSSSSYTPSSTSSTVAATPTVSSTRSDPENINGLNQVIIGIGGMIVAGAQA
ncbi:hypothetical protein GLOTRDRAFT_35963 [Gloeophyllum trabeum ATCC 11539]|uniref:Uncharacterized protein n=1 Tax=Gloeophyllum trabeum (strain ATCC 11539 / FP-39264 / Madison 617) TaxID=670483 RepID=S7RZ68_GLOTA|nr:uncharacterized protein GLOTRDRAFT_35963 [Gloeophyllum trabeum ATCC 11539]EPQ58739.1 hypothetical protein GLOTRDRAFT_35963 [Gloeophyllum trabeum ATCC 11539]